MGSCGEGHVPTALAFQKLQSRQHRGRGRRRNVRNAGWLMQLLPAGGVRGGRELYPGTWRETGSV